VRFSTKRQPTTLPAPSTPRDLEYRRGWGGVYIPPGYGYWGIAPYHWLWWLGWANPYPAHYPARHASLGASIFATALFAAVAIGVVAVLAVGFKKVWRNSY
jgi:hypothetical protein